MDRMTDKRLAEIEATLYEDTDNIEELLQALKAERKRVEELEKAAMANADAAKMAEMHRDELQRLVLALVEGINSAQSHTAEALRLLQWDQLGWDVPEEVIESLGNADSELRALLEDDDE